MTATTISVHPPKTATCATCENAFVPPVLASEREGDATTCPTCARAKIEARDRDQIDAYTAQYEAERAAFLATLPEDEDEGDAE